MSLAELKNPRFAFLRLDYNATAEAINDFLQDEGVVVVDAASASIVWTDGTAAWELEYGDVLVRMVDTIHVFDGFEFEAAFEVV